MTAEPEPWIAEHPELGGGSADAFDFALAEIRLHGNTAIRLASPGVTAIVGGNNVGKSTVLRNVRDHLVAPPGHVPPDFQLVDQITSTKSGSAQDFIAWLGTRAPYSNNGYQWGVRSLGGPPVPLSDAAYYWRAGVGLTASLLPFIVYFADARERLNFLHEVDQRSDIADPPEHPLHHLQDNPALLAEVARCMKDAFSQPVTLDRLGRQVRLRLGTPSVPAPPVDSVTEDYRSALIALPSLARQGDGMRSFLSLLLPLITGSSRVVIVDEPEAFLHPPQAYALGRAISELARDKALQVILATHDKNLLAGLLEPPDVDVSVVRLSRSRDETAAHQLDNTELRTLWKDANLRYTNVLEGLFHRLVVVCEAERDCSFYAASLDAASAQGRTQVPPSEVLFIPSGGKDGMARLVTALSQVRVPIVLSPDLDILDDASKLQLLVQAMGGEWSSFEADYRVATEAFRRPRAPATCNDVLVAIEAALRPLGASRFDSAARDRVLAQTRQADNPWRQLKRYGEAAFSGEAASAAQRLLDALDAMGIVAVRPGELERMAPNLPVRKGPAWLSAALEAGAHTDPPAQSHVARLIAAVSR